MDGKWKFGRWWRETGSYLPSALRGAASKGSPRPSEDNCPLGDTSHPRWRPFLWMEPRNLNIRPRFGPILWMGIGVLRFRPRKRAFLWMKSGILRGHPQNEAFLWTGSGSSGDGGGRPAVISRLPCGELPRRALLGHEDNCRGTEAERTVSLPRNFF